MTSPTNATSDSHEPDELDELEAALREIAFPASPEQEPRFAELFAAIRSLAERRPSDEYVIALLLSAYSKHPLLYAEDAIRSEFFRVAERCWSSGVASSAAHVQAGFVYYDERNYAAASAHFHRAEPRDLGPYWGGIALEYRVCCAVRLRTLGEAANSVDDLVNHYEAFGDDVETPVGLDWALRDTANAGQGATKCVRDQLRRLAASRLLRWDPYLTEDSAGETR